jgi:hypothetical protein
VKSESPVAISQDSFRPALNHCLERSGKSLWFDLGSSHVFLSFCRYRCDMTEAMLINGSCRCGGSRNSMT